MGLRATLVVAVLVIAAEASGGEMPARSAPERLDRVRAQIMKAESVVVGSACGSAVAPWAYRGARGKQLMLQTYSQTERDRAWGTEFAALLLQASDWDSTHKFRGVSKPCNQTHQVPLFTVTWRGRHGRVVGADIYALLSFETRCAVLFEADRPLGTVWLGDRADALFALIRRAMPRDSLVQAMATPAPTVERLDESLQIYTWIDTLPRVIGKVAPRYPEDARRADLEGTVFVQALIGTDGTVQDAFVVGESRKMRALEGPAIDAVWQWTFSPAIHDGAPAAVWVAIPVRFRLR